jgi:hypothetical protein
MLELISNAQYFKIIIYKIHEIVVKFKLTLNLLII